VTEGLWLLIPNTTSPNQQEITQFHPANRISVWKHSKSRKFYDNAHERYLNASELNTLYENLPRGADRQTGGQAAKINSETNTSMRTGFAKITTCMAAAAALTLTSCASEGVSRSADDGDVRARADALIRQMTPTEKAAQLQILPIMKIRGLPTPEEYVADGAGAILFASSPQEINSLQHIAMEKSRLKIPLLFGFDVIHGFVTIFPVPIAMAASWDPDMVEREQVIAASEARAAGVDWVFGPMVDISRDPRWGRIVEGAGEDPYLGSAMAVAQVLGFQGPQIGTPGHVISGAKHFAGYGAALGGRDYDEANISDSDLWNVYLPPFKAAVDAGTGSIMSAYMPLNGVPASANHWLLTEVLRDKWGFTGWVVSDNQAVKDLKTHGLTIDPEDSAARALNAGLDVEMAFGNGAFSNLPKALTDGKVSEEQIDDAVRRVLEAKIKLGLFDHPYVDEVQAAVIAHDPAHLEAARIAAERSAVLLRNENNLLPLDRQKLHSVVVIGPFASSEKDALGPWVFPQNTPAVQSILDGIRAKIGAKVTLRYEPGVAIPPRTNPSPIEAMLGSMQRPAPADNVTGIAAAVKAAKLSDVAILVLGEGANMSGEWASVSSLSLPGRQQDLLDAVTATGKPVIVILMNGRPLDLRNTKAAAILDMWFPGSRGGDASANLLFGDAVPGGKLPFTWPRNASQLPLYYAHMTTHDPKDADARYWNESNAPLYPFGYGLSYSTFAYSNLKVDKTKVAPGDSVGVTVDLKNTGNRTADEVAQLYIFEHGGSTSRPVRELKGFKRVTLKAGEVRTMTFQLGPDELHYWDPTKRNWIIDNAIVDVAVGGDSRAPFGATFQIASSH
jgi:beta-glucosidase